MSTKVDVHVHGYSTPNELKQWKDSCCKLCWTI